LQTSSTIQQFATPPPAFWFHKLHAQNVAVVGQVLKKNISPASVAPELLASAPG
jgi:hypothetical protein